MTDGSVRAFVNDVRKSVRAVWGVLTLLCYCAIRFTDSRGVKDCLVYVNTFKVKFLYEMLDRAGDIFYKVSGFTVVWQVSGVDQPNVISSFLIWSQAVRARSVSPVVALVYEGRAGSKSMNRRTRRVIWSFLIAPYTGSVMSAGNRLRVKYTPSYWPLSESCFVTFAACVWSEKS